MARIVPLLWICCLIALGCSRETSTDIEVRVATVAVDPNSNSPVIVLEELAGARKLPIWIGFAEAQSIAAELERERPQRPNSHDLAKRLIDRLDGVVQRVVVTELSDGIYYARLVVVSQGRTLSVDARPSDAIAIGLRYQAPLFVREVLFDQSLEEIMGETGQPIRGTPGEPTPHRQLRLRSL
jgi:uncharacterized protein